MAHGSIGSSEKKSLAALLGIDPEALRLVVQWSFRCTGTFLGTGKNVRMDGASVTRQ